MAPGANTPFGRGDVDLQPHRLCGGDGPRPAAASAAAAAAAAVARKHYTHSYMCTVVKVTFSPLLFLYDDTRASSRVVYTCVFILHACTRNVHRVRRKRAAKPTAGIDITVKREGRRVSAKASFTP